MEKEKTVLQELIEQMYSTYNLEHTTFQERAGIASCIGKAKKLLNKEKQQIIDAVNEHDKKCINICNNMVKKINPKIDSLFEYGGNEGDKYYEEKYNKIEYK